MIYEVAEFSSYLGYINLKVRKKGPKFYLHLSVPIRYSIYSLFVKKNCGSYAKDVCCLFYADA